ncbi:glycosyltransferase family 2 protein, partial [Streptomyces sp. NPDC003514]
MTAAPAYSVVVPTIGRPCLADCLRALAAADGHPPEEIVVVDDRPDARERSACSCAWSTWCRCWCTPVTT